MRRPSRLTPLFGGCADISHLPFDLSRPFQGRIEGVPAWHLRYAAMPLLRSNG